MRFAAIVAFVAVVHAGSASTAAQQPTDGSPLGVTPFADLFAAKSKPAAPPRFLFPTPAPTPTPRLNQPPDVPSGQQPTVVCGMTMIPADPNVDPAIRREVPEGGPRFLIRSVDPTICRRP